MTFEPLAGNLARVRDVIARVQAREGVERAVRIVAVTKGYGPEAARAAVAAGLADVGENRVQEAVAKLDGLTDLEARWHLIGHLQTNKAKFVPGRFAMVQSVDSVRVAEALEKAIEAVAGGAGAGALEVLVQVNVSGEGQKYGCAPDEAERVAARVRQLPRLRLRGLMTMAPFTDDETMQRRVFEALRRARARLEAVGFDLPELSMGMSADYPAAVAEGATMLRLGTVLFGERPT